MTIYEFIDELEKLEDKNLDIWVENNRPKLITYTSGPYKAIEIVPNYE